jgi:hypothetical protein
VHENELNGLVDGREELDLIYLRKHGNCPESKITQLCGPIVRDILFALQVRDHFEHIGAVLVAKSSLDTILNSRVVDVQVKGRQLLVQMCAGEME